MKFNKMTLMIFKEWLACKLSGKSLDVRQTWVETPLKFETMTEYLNWFDTTDSVESTLRKAELDWRHRFASFPYFAKQKKSQALEIGFGGGRLLCQASRDFDHVYGVDIHRAFDMTREFLTSQGCENFDLVHRDDIGSIPDGSIDLIYSFIVFQHFDTMEEVDYYLNHIKRLLATDGIAHIYFGKNKGEGVKVTPTNMFTLRDCSLFIAPELMREHLEKQFSVLEFRDSLPKDPTTDQGESGQAMVIFQNPK